MPTIDDIAIETHEEHHEFKWFQYNMVLKINSEGQRDANYEELHADELKEAADEVNARAAE